VSPSSSIAAAARASAVLRAAALTWPPRRTGSGSPRRARARQPLARAVHAVPAAAGSRFVRQPRQHPGQLAPHAGRQSSQLGGEHATLGEPIQVPQRIHDRQQRQLHPHRQRARGQRHRPGRPRPAQCLGHQPGLADAGLAGHQHQPGAAAQQRVLEHGQLRPPSNQRPRAHPLNVLTSSTPVNSHPTAAAKDRRSPDMGSRPIPASPV
jgi:hypothetical protein